MKPSGIKSKSKTQNSLTSTASDGCFTEKGEPSRAKMQAVTYMIVNSHALIRNINEARAIDFVLLRYAPQSRVVRRKPAHDQAANFDGIELKPVCSISAWSVNTTESNTAALSSLLL